MDTTDRELEGAGLIRVLLSLRPRQFNERKLFAYPACLEWMKKDVPRMVTGRLQSPNTPAEQLIQRLLQWNTGEFIAYDRMLNDLNPKTDGVWELKTADLRIFGWIYRPKLFVAVCGGYADDYKKPTKIKKYSDDQAAVLTARNSLAVKGQKFVTGAIHELI